MKNLKNLQKKLRPKKRQITSRYKLTWNDKVGKPTKLPNHDKTALTNSNMAINAIRLAAMLATNLMEADAPAAAASNIFLSFLENKIIILN